MINTMNGVDETLLQRITCEFLEMPGLRLTDAQAKRLLGLDDASCRALLKTLIDAKVLFRTRDGSVMLVSREPVRAALPPSEQTAVA